MTVSELNVLTFYYFLFCTETGLLSISCSEGRGDFGNSNVSEFLNCSTASMPSMFHLKLLSIPLPFDRDVMHTKRSLIMHGEATNDIRFSSSLMATCEVIKETANNRLVNSRRNILKRLLFLEESFGDYITN